MMSGSRKLLNWAASTRKISVKASREGGQEPAAFDAQLAGFAGVVELVALRQDFGCFLFQEAERLVERADGHAAKLDGVELLKAVERARAGLFLERGKGAEGDQLAVRPFDVGAFELTGVEALDALELRDNLVAAAVEVEPVDEVAAHQCREVRADGRHVEAERRHLVAVHDQLDFGLVELGVNDRRKGKHAAGGGLLLQLLGEFQDRLRFVSGADDQFNREGAATRQGGRA